MIMKLGMEHISMIAVHYAKFQIDWITHNLARGK